MATARLEVGATAPEFTLDNQDGNPVSLSDYRGKKVILYFYPEASTPACATQACDFRDSLASLAESGYRVVAVSKNEVAELKAFEAEEALTFPLLADPSLAVHQLYATWGEKNMYGRIVIGCLRSTFVIDDKGVITHALYNVKAKGHISMLRKKLRFA